MPTRMSSKSRYSYGNSKFLRYIAKTKNQERKKHLTYSIHQTESALRNLESVHVQSGKNWIKSDLAKLFAEESKSQKKLFRSMEKSVVESDDENESDEDEEHCSTKLWIVDNYKIAKYRNL